MSQVYNFVVSVIPETKMVSIDIQKMGGKGKRRRYEFPPDIALEIAGDLFDAYFAARDGNPAKHGFHRLMED